MLDDFKYQDGIEGVVEELKSNVNRCAPEDAKIHLLYGTPESWAVPFGSEDLQSDEIGVVYRDADRCAGTSSRSDSDKEQDQRLAYDVLRRRGGVYAWHDGNYDLKWLQVQPVPVEVN